MSAKKIFYKITDALIYVARKIKIYDSIYSASISIINFINKQKFLKFYSRFIKRDCLCFDIGANLGSRTDTMLKLGARVVAVEPQDSCMEKLEKKYKGNNRVSLVKKAIGKENGKEKLLVSDAHTISSMSRDWINSLKASDMFFVSSSAFEWQESIDVQVITLDQLISEYGIPDFCKIDVEGYEYNVLSGLSRPISMISFEFTPTNEFIQLAINTVEHLASIGRVEFNYTLGESVTFDLENWVKPEEMSDLISSLPQKTSVCGDIYARFY
jgi:FkbM family methyltransferase